MARSPLPEVRSAPRPLSLALLLPLGLGLAGACRSVEPAELVAANKTTARDTIKAFQTYLRADLYEQEYGCFSSDFKRREGVSLFTYSEFRDRLAKEQPWYRLIGSAEIVEERELGPARREIDLAIAGKKLRATLVREDFFRIWWHDAYEDGRRPAGTLVRFTEPSDSPSKMVAEFPLERSGRTVEDLSRATVERLWLIDGVELLSDD
ncbi:MAG: hypothetical protein NTV21_17680 [Planctomycetota bacterium]|nr:hypothetical protein [Planctomycetota bacterium]